MTEEAKSAQRLVRVGERSELNVSQQHVELGTAVMKTMMEICKTGKLKQSNTIRNTDLLYWLPQPNPTVKCTTCIPRFTPAILLVGCVSQCVCKLKLCMDILKLMEKTTSKISM
jgi:hypothetical protein